MTLSDTSLSPLELIRKTLLNVAGTRRTGSQIHSLIYNACPGFDVRGEVGMPTGPGALTKFLNTNFPDIVHDIGKHGGDKLYSIGGPGPTAESGSSPGADGSGMNLWAVFASPGLRQQLVFERATGRSFVRPQGAVISEDQIVILPITHDEFRIIAENFAETAPPDLKQELQHILANPDFIFQNWVSTLRDKHPSHYHRWGLHRVQAIIDLFRRRLTEAEIPEDQLEAAVNRLIEAQSATYKERLFARTRSAIYSEPAVLGRQELRAVPQTFALPAAQSGASINPRSLAILAINNMSITEIRQLAIPLGAILDAELSSKK